MQILGLLDMNFVAATSFVNNFSLPCRFTLAKTETSYPKNVGPEVVMNLHKIIIGTHGPVLG
jgi:hypothetical protein